jgi:hypothetical protein
MNYGNRWQRFLALTVLLTLCLFTGGVLAQSNSYNLTWSTIDGGGALTRIGEGYTVSSSIGQPDAGVLASDQYSIVGGFWAQGSVNPLPQARVYLPLVQNNEP